MIQLFRIAGLSAALVVATTASVHAVEMPARKSGLWEIKTETRADGRSMPGPMTMQMCVDRKRDDATADLRDMRAPKQRCSKTDVRRSGEQTVIDSVCTHEGRTVTSRTTISGDLATDYRMETVARFAPPMHGMATMASTMTGKWLGPCKSGQTHGSTTMMDMPGMGAGGFQLDPQTLERMRRMQRQ